jgi:hypothetical protein
MMRLASQGPITPIPITAYAARDDGRAKVDIQANPNEDPDTYKSRVGKKTGREGTKISYKQRALTLYRISGECESENDETEGKGENYDWRKRAQKCPKRSPVATMAR